MTPSTHNLRIEVNQPGFEIFTFSRLDSVSAVCCNYMPKTIKIELQFSLKPIFKGKLGKLG